MKLELISVDQHKPPIVLDQFPVIVGLDPGADVCLDDSSVGHYQCMIDHSDGELMVWDLGTKARHIRQRPSRLLRNRLCGPATNWPSARADSWCNMTTASPSRCGRGRARRMAALGLLFPAAVGSDGQPRSLAERLYIAQFTQPEKPLSFAFFHPMVEIGVYQC